MIDPAERARMMRARSIGPKMIGYLEQIGVRTLGDMAGADAAEIAMRIDALLMRRHINRLGIKALQNLIDHANSSAAGDAPAAAAIERRNKRGRA